VTIGMGSLALWISVCVNIAAAVLMMREYRSQVRRRLYSEAGAKRVYSWGCFVIGFVVALAVFYILLFFAGAPVGHGEILIAAPVLNALLSFALLLVGRIVIGWKPLQ
jgi:bacteriorhodopsin